MPNAKFNQNVYRERSVVCVVYSAHATTGAHANGRRAGQAWGCAFCDVHVAGECLRGAMHEFRHHRPYLDPSRAPSAEKEASGWHETFSGEAQARCHKDGKDEDAKASKIGRYSTEPRDRASEGA
jgi:hypothetical protein